MEAWIARDIDGSLCLYTTPPVKHIKIGEWIPRGEPYMSVVSEYDLPSDINPQWSDTEPIEVEILITRRK